MGVSIPQPFEADISGSLGSVGPVTIAGLPSTYHINIDHLPQIDLKLEPVTLNPITLELKPVDFNIAIKELPSIRAHLPANFSVGLNVLGMDLVCVRLCGEAQVITEPYVRNPCEVCGEIGERHSRLPSVTPIHG